MKTRALASWGGILTVFSILSLGCSSVGARDADPLDEDGPAPPTGRPPPPGGTKDGGGAGDDSGDRDDLAVIDVPETSCMTLAVPCAEVYAPRAISPLHDLQAAGEGFLARGLWDSGFVLFDADGSNATPELVTTGALDRVSASGSDIHVATVDTEGVKARRYDMTGMPLGDVMPISDDRADEVAIGQSSKSALVVWSTFTRVALRGIGESGLMGDIFDLESSVRKDDFRIAIASSTTEALALAWSDRRVADSHYRTFFVRASEEGVRSVPRTVESGLERQRVIALRETKTGYVLLLEIGENPWIVPLSRFGDRSGPAYRFMGIERAHSLAVNESGEMLLAGLRDDGRDALILLDENGAPKSEWRCLHAYPSDGEHVVSIAPTDKGYAVLYRSIIAQELIFDVDAAAMQATEEP